MAVDHVLDNDEDLMKSLLEERGQGWFGKRRVFGDPAPLAGCIRRTVEVRVGSSARSWPRICLMIELGS
jgi:hypothetical protein